MTATLDTEADAFCLEEATIEDLHLGIMSGKATCVEVVQRYIARVRAFNGVCSVLVTSATRWRSTG